VREDAITPGLDAWLGQLFDDEHADGTCAALTEASRLPDDNRETVELDVRRRLKECETKLARYREVLEAGTDAPIVGDWIAKVDSQRPLERQLQRKPTDRALTPLKCERRSPGSGTSSASSGARTLISSGGSTTSWAYASRISRRRGVRRSGRSSCTRGGCRRETCQPTTRETVFDIAA
jgi:hypothetical protein